MSHKDVEKELREVVKAMGIDGIPILRLSEMDWVSPATSGGKEYNQKHSQTLFVLRDRPSFIRPMSRDWNLEDHNATENDVFVILQRFEAYPGFERHLQTDKILCSHFKMDFPKVIGYKATASKPVAEADCPGKSYREWRKGLYERIRLLPEVRKLLMLYRWSEMTDGSVSRHEREQADALPDLIGHGHPIMRFLRRRRWAEKTWRKTSAPAQSSIRRIASVLGDMGMAPAGVQHQYESLKEAYPLLLGRANGGGLCDLWDDEDAGHWVQYVKLIDSLPIKQESEQNHADDQEDSAHSDQRINQRCLGGEDAHDPTECAQLCVAA